MARHQSVGAEDQVAISPDDEPTVPNDAQLDQETAEADTPYEVGTTHPSECYEADGNLTEEGVNRMTMADAYCGELYYNENLDESLEVVSPPDQDIPETIGVAGEDAVTENPIATFDVVRADLVAPFPGVLLTCIPLCPSETTPGGDQRHQLFYDTASEVGLTNNSEETKENQRDDRFQAYGLQAGYPNAAQRVQAETGLWEMNGWANPNGEHTWVGFLEDGGGNPISAERLNQIVDGADLPEDAVPKVCGFTEDRELSTTVADNFCEQELKYFDNGDSATRGDFREYGDRCASPTYVCNAAGGPAWRADPPSFLGSVGSPYLGNGEYVNIPGLGFFNFGDQDKFMTWHWVVAPSPQDCVAQEPVVSFDSGEGSVPYLAHDLDSYVPSTRLSGVDTPSPGHVEDYSDAAIDKQVDAAFDTLNNATNVSIPAPVEEQIDQAFREVNSAANETGPVFEQVNALLNDTFNQTNALLNTTFNQTDQLTQPVNDAIDENVGDTAKPSRMEPNANPALNPDADSSQSKIEVERSLEGACERATSSESPETVDPWLDMIDSELTTTTTTITAYGNTDDNQDHNNNPGPDRFGTSGTIGLFTDKNDDGTYETPGNTYRAQDIVNAGAYPMIWDIRVENPDDAEPQITTDGACQFDDSDTTNLAADAKRLGYGPNTGLFQLIYLQEPTVADTGLTAVQNRVVYGNGNNIYLLASQSVRELWEGPTEIDPGDPGDPVLDNEVDQAIRDLQRYADEQNGDLLPPSVEVPGASFGLESDFTDQCGASTGGFSSQISFTHDCQQLECTGDTVLTKYVFEVTTDGGKLGEGNFVPGFSGLSDQTKKFDGFDRHNVWTDVDPLDGNPDRNDDGTEGPPT